MPQHTDKFGRVWNYTPDHNADRMLQIPLETMRLFYDFQLALRRAVHRFDALLPKDAPVDCYLCRPGAGALVESHGWWIGIRLSDEPSDYRSLCMDKRLVSLMVEYHRRASGMREWKAIVELTEIPNYGD